MNTEEEKLAEELAKEVVEGGVELGHKHKEILDHAE